MRMARRPLQSVMRWAGPSTREEAIPLVIGVELAKEQMRAAVICIQEFIANHRALTSLPVHDRCCGEPTVIIRKSGAQYGFK